MTDPNNEFTDLRWLSQDIGFFDPKLDESLGKVTVREIPILGPLSKKFCEKRIANRWNGHGSL
jgi:hypothetical protein